MKAVIRYRDVKRGNLREVTIEVENNEVNEIIREFCKEKKLPWWTYVHTVKCEGIEYKWKGLAAGAGVPKEVRT